MPELRVWEPDPLTTAISRLADATSRIKVLAAQVEGVILSLSRLDAGGESKVGVDHLLRTLEGMAPGVMEAGVEFAERADLLKGLIGRARRAAESSKKEGR